MSQNANASMDSIPVPIFSVTKSSEQLQTVYEVINCSDCRCLRTFSVCSGILIHTGRTYRDPHMCTLYPEQLWLPEAQPSSAWLKYANAQEKLRNEKKKQNQILQWMRKLARSQGFSSNQDANNFKDLSDWKHKCGGKKKGFPLKVQLSAFSVAFKWKDEGTAKVTPFALFSFSWKSQPSRSQDCYNVAGVL